MASLTLHSDGTTSSDNSSGYATSENYKETGVTARNGMSTRTVADTTRIDDDEIVQIDGMELKAGMARDLGLLDAHSQNEGLKASDATQGQTREASTASTTGHDAYDQSVSELNMKIEAGQMGPQEAGEYSTALGQVALAGMTVSEISETIDGLADGSINPMELDQNQRDIAANLETTVQTAATKSAMSELGQDGFNRISEIARGDAEFKGVLRQYASMRALGKADHTWAEFLVDAEAWSRGDR